MQDLLDNPNILDPAQAEAYQIFREDKAAYSDRVREQARQNPPN